MVTRTEWVNSVLNAWRGEPCPRCGRELRPYHVDDEGVVWGECPNCEADFWIAREYWPAKLDPEKPEQPLTAEGYADTGDLPF